ncbi:hypothetical protein HZA57_08030 [Candidatus Poribacteria bacterium]|nr:hypothetical protein [Candidatus Poribacteria bacterium]
MIRKLVEADFAAGFSNAGGPRVAFWLRECRTPDLLIELCGRLPEELARELPGSTRLALATSGRERELESALREEEDIERAKDRECWQPLNAELEHWRRERSRTAG